MLETGFVRLLDNLLGTESGENWNQAAQDGHIDMQC
jgi:hypothetical protein